MRHFEPEFFIYNTFEDSIIIELFYTGGSDGNRIFAQILIQNFATLEKFFRKEE
jgi:hypothetical protein